MKKTMAWAEWKQLLRTRKMLVPMIAILFIPVLYAGMFLWAFWDPYDAMNELPVAVVNLDEGAELEGEHLALGQELVDKLVDSKQFDFQALTKKDAEKGLKNQDYYIAIEIPKSFSQHATTLLDDDPQKLTIVYKPNEGYNFLSAQIGETAMDRIRAEVNEKVSSTYAEQLFDSITEMGDGFGEAADGAGKLNDGATDLSKGADDLKGYLETLASSTITLADGSNKLAQGANDAAKGANTLHAGLGTLSSGASELQQGAHRASEGANDLKEGLTSYTQAVENLKTNYAEMGVEEQTFITKLNELNGSTTELNGAIQRFKTGSANINAGINGLSQQLAPMIATLPEPQKTQLQETLNQLQTGSGELAGKLDGLSKQTPDLEQGSVALNAAAGQLAGAHSQGLAVLKALSDKSPEVRDGANKLAVGNGALAAGLTTLSEGATAAHKGSSDLAQGLSKLTEGTGTLTEGTDTLASKSQDLADGSVQLANGMVELQDGTSTLQEKLREANETANEVNPTEKTYDMAAAPVDVENEAINNVPNYGTGFAPYFLSLGLFVGALLLSIVFPLVEPAIKPTGAIGWFMSKVSVLAIVGFVQAILAVVIVKYGLGMETVALPEFIITAIITSYTFIAIVQMLVSILGDPGRFVAILVLILQLTTSAGTFPLELIPRPLQFFNTILPMTYSVQAFKAAISTGDMAHLWVNNGILISFIVVCLAITFGYFALLYKKRHSKETVVA